MVSLLSSDGIEPDVKQSELIVLFDYKQMWIKIHYTFSGNNLNMRSKNRHATALLQIPFKEFQNNCNDSNLLNSPNSEGILHLKIVHIKVFSTIPLTTMRTKHYC